MEIQTSVAPSETWLREDLERRSTRCSSASSGMAFLQRELADDSEVRRPGVRSHRLRDLDEPCESCQKHVSQSHPPGRDRQELSSLAVCCSLEQQSERKWTHSSLWCWSHPYHKSTGRATLAMRWDGVKGDAIKLLKRRRWQVQERRALELSQDMCDTRCMYCVISVANNQFDCGCWAETATSAGW